MESLSPVTQAVIETIGVIALAVLGAIIGLTFSRLRGPAWSLGFVLPLIVLIVMAIPKWIPSTQSWFIFRWIGSGRTVYALSGAVCAMLLTTPLSRLPNRNEKIAVAAFAVFFCCYFSVLPFLMPAVSFGAISRLETTIDFDGVCLQNEEYDCGPAAAVTALRAMGIKAQEAPLAIAARTTTLTGTAPDLLCSAIEKTYGVSCGVVYPRSITELKGKKPCIVGVDFAFLVNHYVTVLEVTDSKIVVGDPLDGKNTLTHEQFMKKWRKFAIVFD
jgi:hypothetical protein